MRHYNNRVWKNSREKFALLNADQTNSGLVKRDVRYNLHIKANFLCKCENFRRMVPNIPQTNLKHPFGPSKIAA